MKQMILITASAALLMAGAAIAQSSSTPSDVNQRRENQQDRIAQGVQSGSLTAGETANLEKKEAGYIQFELNPFQHAPCSKYDAEYMDD